MSPIDASPVEASLTAAQRLAQAVDALCFSAPVTHVYNPLDYAWDCYEQYVRRMNPAGSRVLFLGMNPGPWGMAQTGVPFGHVPTVRDWLRIHGTVGRPAREHPKRPVEGLQCKRGEVSGQRLWGLFRSRFQQPEAFFQQHFVANYCPLVFMEDSGRNRTPDKLPASERASLVAACDEHLARLVEALRPEWLVGIGVYAEGCLKRVADESQNVTRILHPSPASPAANRGWGEAATEQLVAAGVWS